MKLRLLPIALALFLAAETVGLAQNTGLWVAEQVDRRDTGNDAGLNIEMALIDQKGRETKRNLTIIRKDFEGQDKLLLRFTYPNDIEGTSFLVWEHKDRDNERFLYLPALGRVRRIATREKEENFAGTDFSYEDISGRKLEDYTYELVREEENSGNICCYLLASYPKEADARYPKILSWVGKDNFVVIKAEYYNKREELEKTFEILDLQKIEGIWTGRKLLMRNHKTAHQTVITVTDVRYNRGIAESSFEKRNLEK